MIYGCGVRNVAFGSLFSTFPGSLMFGQKLHVATLLALTTAQRCQTLSLIDIDNIEFSSECLKIRIMDILKQTKSNRHTAELCIEAYPDAQICVLKTMAQYLENTQV